MKHEPLNELTLHTVQSTTCSIEHLLSVFIITPKRSFQPMTPFSVLGHNNYSSHSSMLNMSFFIIILLIVNIRNSYLHYIEQMNDLGTIFAR